MLREFGGGFVCDASGSTRGVLNDAGAIGGV